ncbi:MAG: pyruvate dehydrogenase (acetyl-transferring) E1 component subunit alpha [Nitrospirae bacterium]|nr:pyruvate dehydrogenase (acetyl-transferring) E1 component subunit alpha [Nitrospirota bacterium]
MVEKKEDLINYLETMLKIRYFEEKVSELLGKDLIKGTSHIYIGEESVAVGAIAAIREDDYIASTHRGHGHCLAKGGELKKMMAELCGRATGYCKGRGGSMHIADVAKGNLGATGIVGSNIPVATGAALSMKMQKMDRVVLCFFGDGASNTGGFHESLNMASVWKLPVIYICENNLYGMSVSVKRALSVTDIAVRAVSYNMPGEIVDGMNVLEVKEVVAKAVRRARKGDGPSLIECKTYRYYGHSRSDPRVYRTREEEAEWKKKDPVESFKKKLLEEDVVTEEEIDNLEESIQQEVNEATEYALSSPWPSVDELTCDVFFTG